MIATVGYLLVTYDPVQTTSYTFSVCIILYKSQFRFSAYINVNIQESIVIGAAIVSGNTVLISNGYNIHSAFGSSAVATDSNAAPMLGDYQKQTSAFTYTRVPLLCSPAVNVRMTREATLNTSNSTNYAILIESKSYE